MIQFASQNTYIIFMNIFWNKLEHLCLPVAIFKALCELLRKEDTDDSTASVENLFRK
jgi:hypothetical protein